MADAWPRLPVRVVLQTVTVLGGTVGRLADRTSRARSARRVHQRQQNIPRFKRLTFPWKPEPAMNPDLPVRTHPNENDHMVKGLVDFQAPNLMPFTHSRNGGGERDGLPLAERLANRTHTTPLEALMESRPHEQLEDLLSGRSMSEQVYRCMEFLDPDDQAILDARSAMDKRTFADLGADFGFSKTNALKRYHRALRRLRLWVQCHQ